MAEIYDGPDELPAHVAEMFDQPAPAPVCEGHVWRWQELDCPACAAKRARLAEAESRYGRAWL